MQKNLRSPGWNSHHAAKRRVNWLFKLSIRRRLFPVIFIILTASLLRLIYLDRVDITPDEDHYISESQRLLRKDPYISVRHHPFQHPRPNIGHPFLGQVLNAGVYRLVGFSVWSARLPSVLAGISTLILLLFFGGEFGGWVSVYAGLLFALLPFAVRFNRDAHLDSLLTLWITMVVLCLCRWHNITSKKRNIWLLGAGIASGFAISTKLDGGVALMMSGVLLWILTGSFGKNLFQKLMYWARLFLITVIPAGLIFLILNNPSAYLDGIINPADPSFSVYSFEFWKSAAISLRDFWPNVFLTLLSPVVTILWLISSVWLLRRQDTMGKFLIWWQIMTLMLFVFHRPSVSGEYGILPAIPAILMSLSYFLFRVSETKNIVVRVAMFCLPLIVLPYTFWYGLGLKPLGYYQRSSVMNRMIGDSFFADAIKTINSSAPRDARVFFLPQQNYPFFALRKDLSWSYYGDITEFEVFIVENPTLLQSLPKLRLLKKLEKLQDGKLLVRYIYQK